jgi:hypothetical protein
MVGLGSHRAFTNPSINNYKCSTVDGVYVAALGLVWALLGAVTANNSQQRPPAQPSVHGGVAVSFPPV